MQYNSKAYNILNWIMEINVWRKNIVLWLGSMRMDCFIGESCYKGAILQRNYRKMTIHFMVIFL